MDANEYFPSRWLKAEDVGNNKVAAEIKDVKAEKVGDDEKLVLYFHELTKGVVLNRTNFEKLKKAYGNETNAWIGKTVEIYTTLVAYKGEEVEAIRLRTL